MKKASLLALLVALVSCVQGTTVQAPNLSAQPDRANAVKAAYVKSYNAYLQYAEGSDELLPLSRKGDGGFGNWGATAIDALSTHHLMGLSDLFSRSVAFAEKVDFSRTTQSSISIFETTIRYVGALLSAYELDGKRNAKLVQQAQVIGDHLLRGWTGNNDLPYNTLRDWNNFGGPQTDGVIIAETGTLVIELDRLSKFSGNDTYRDFGVRAMRATVESKQSLPDGLYGQQIDPQTGEGSNLMTWGGGSDSFFEYLIKYAQLIGRPNDIWAPAWIKTVKASIEHLITRASGTSKQLTYLTDYTTSSGQIPRWSHLGCFAGGNWILGGRLLRNDGIVQYGLELAESCINTYTSSASGIGPESFVFKTQSGSSNGVTINDPAGYYARGFDYDSPAYILRPEVLESVFYAYRATGDARWQNLAWTAFQALRKHCDSGSGAWASINDIRKTNTEQIDNSESFVYAETLKYLFLTFADPDLVSLDTHVFNTEGHPFQIDDPDADFTSLPVGTLPTPSGSAKGSSRTAEDVPAPLLSGLPAGLRLLQSVAEGVQKVLGRDEPAAPAPASGPAGMHRRRSPAAFF